MAWPPISAARRCGRTPPGAGEAWTAWRSGDIDAFGHGESCGAWFLRVNLMRDLFALRKQETSGWDSWRSTPEDRKALDDKALAEGGRIAGMTCRVGLVPPLRAALRQERRRR